MAIDFSFPPQVEDVRRRVIDFMAGEVRPAVEKAEADDADRNAWRRVIIELRGRAKEWQLWLPHMPKEWGGMGLGPTAMAAVSSEAAKVGIGRSCSTAKPPTRATCTRCCTPTIRKRATWVRCARAERGPVSP